jgi:hypothetical protein
MSYMFVFAPKSGPLSSTDIYCPPDGDGSTHSALYFSCALDVGGLANELVFFYSSDAVQSIRVRHFAPWQHMCLTRAGEPYVYDDGNSYLWDRGLFVDMYSEPNGGGGRIATLLYGHVAPTRGDGEVVNGHSGIALGYLPAQPEPMPYCYRGPHVHMECDLGSYVTTACYADLYAGVSGLYRIPWY